MTTAAKRIFLATASLLGAAAMLASTLVADAGARPLRTGIFDTDVYKLGEPLAFARTREAGATLARIFVRWDEIAPVRKPGTWNPRDPGERNYGFDTLDRTVAQAKNARVEPILAVVGTPGWARRDPDCSPVQGQKYVCAPNANDYGDFARALAGRYNGSFGGHPRVRYFQAWSEPNLRWFFEPNSTDVYRELLNSFTPSVKDGHRGNKVIAGGLAPIKVPPDTRGPLEFMRKLLCMKGRGKPRPSCSAKTRFDIWSHHPYTTGGPTHSSGGKDDTSLGDLPEMTRLLRAADRAGHIRSSFKRVPFWVTEFSWDTKPPDPGGVPIRLHARWVAEAFYRMWKAGVSTVVWFQLRDHPRGNKYSESYQSGLYFKGSSLEADRPKKATLQAFRFPFVALKAGRRAIKVWGRTPDSKRGRVKIQKKSGGRFRTIGRARASGSGVFQETLRGVKPGGLVRATVRASKVPGKTSLPFAVKKTRDFYQPPFG